MIQGITQDICRRGARVSASAIAAILLHMNRIGQQTVVGNSKLQTPKTPNAQNQTLNPKPYILDRKHSDQVLMSLDPTRASKPETLTPKH